MRDITEVIDNPLWVFALSLVALWLVTAAGAYLSALHTRRHETIPDDFGTILSATLTLSALIIGFTFSMAISRYEQRKNCEAAEANSIGTEFARAALLSPTDRESIQSLLKLYLAQRIEFYTAASPSSLAIIRSRTSALQGKLWAAVVGSSPSRSPAIDALIVAEMNTVLDSEGYTQAAWWNKIPISAWLLMFAIALISQLLVGFGAHSKITRLLPAVLPLAVSISFFLIADIDSPRAGIIRVGPQNLLSVSESVNTQP
jgi:hypothetical protein